MAVDSLYRVSMQSTCIDWAAYDPFTSELEVKFKSGGTVYTFSGFPAAKWKLFTSATSKGKFYHAHIEGRYPRK